MLIVLKTRKTQWMTETKSRLAPHAQNRFVSLTVYKDHCQAANDVVDWEIRLHSRSLRRLGSGRPIDDPKWLAVELRFCVLSPHSHRLDVRFHWRTALPNPFGSRSVRPALHGSPAVQLPATTLPIHPRPQTYCGKVSDPRIIDQHINATEVVLHGRPRSRSSPLH